MGIVIFLANFSAAASARSRFVLGSGDSPETGRLAFGLPSSESDGALFALCIWILHGTFRSDVGRDRPSAPLAFARPSI